MELLNTGILFDVNAQGQGTMEEFICDRVRETFIENPDTLQNIHGLSAAHTSATADWSLHITPAESGGHYNIVNLMDSVIVPAMQKYGILVKAALDIQNREIHLTVAGPTMASSPSRRTFRISSRKASPSSRSAPM